MIWVLKEMNYHHAKFEVNKFKNKTKILNFKLKVEGNENKYTTKLL